MINSSMVFVKMGGDDEKSLFHKNDTEALEKKLIKLSAWLQERKEKQAEMKIFENPAFTTNEVQGKACFSFYYVSMLLFQIKALDKELKGFMKKMKAERTVNLNTDKNAKKTNKKKEKEASEKTDDNEKKEDNKTEGKDSDKKTEL